ncbi:cilia- and flagella-associated protein 45 [Ctenocephalides felis]|uniref:cilia- and flagella-associated protein 45 n=1 Tax=Ctenocephalides felis TaxID=7515 RepID=UPI000E6E19EB|nr:cilia- and flagella-associated protein 45 [Ctenocephalides felis]
MAPLSCTPNSGKRVSKQNLKCIPGTYLHHKPTECYHLLHGRPIHRQPDSALEGKEVISIANQDHVRKLLVPSTKHNIYPAVWHAKELEAIRKRAQVVTSSEMKEAKIAAAQKEERLQKELQERKTLMTHSLKQPKCGPNLFSIQSEAKRRHMHLLRRSFELKQEQQPEAKEINRIIISTKCQAVRDAQIAEKEHIAREKMEEEARIAKMVEQDRQRALMEEEEKLARSSQNKKVFVSALHDQLKELELERMLEAERLEEEGRANNRLMIAMQKEDIEKLEEKRRKQQQTRDDLKKANDELEHYRMIEVEEQRIADLKLAEYMRRKLEQQRIFDQERKAQKLAKAKEIFRLQKAQSSALEMQAMQDEINAQRVQEEVEREFRRKERAKAQKEAEVAKSMSEARVLQMADIQRQQATQAAREEQEFMRLLEHLKAERAKEEERDRINKEKQTAYRDEIVNQINLKEKIRREERAMKLLEGNALRLEDENRLKHVRDLTKQKIEKLRESRLPEKYIIEMQRKIALKLDPKK